MSNALLRELVLNQALKITPFTYLDNTFYVKELDVGTMNYIQRKLRELVLNQALKITPFTYLDNTFYVKELDVGTMNYIQRKLRQIKMKLAEEQDIYLDEEDSDQFNEAMNRVYDEFDVARMLAFKLCDEKGELLFDAENEEDLRGLNRLGQGFSNAVFNAEGGNGKNSPTDDNSK